MIAHVFALCCLRARMFQIYVYLLQLFLASPQGPARRHHISTTHLPRLLPCRRRGVQHLRAWPARGAASAPSP